MMLHLIFLQLIFGAWARADCSGTNEINGPCGSAGITDQSQCESSYGVHGNVGLTCKWVNIACLSSGFCMLPGNDVAPPAPQFVNAAQCSAPTHEGRSVGGSFTGRCGAPIDCGGGGCTTTSGWNGEYSMPSAEHLYQQAYGGSSVQCVKVTYNHWAQSGSNGCAAPFQEGDNTDVTPENCAKICQATPGCRGFSMLYGKSFLSNGRCSFCTFTNDDPASAGSSHSGYDAWDVMGPTGCKVV